MLVTDQPENIAETPKNDLDSLPIPGAHPLQIPAIEATFVKFTGSSGELLDNPPDQDEERTYIVKAKCSGYDIRTRADGERRVTAVMDIESCYERGKVPIVDENQRSLFPVPDAEADGEGGDE